MQNTTKEGSHTPTPWVVVIGKDKRTPIYITSERPLFAGAAIPVRIASMTNLTGYAGAAKANAELICAAVNAWNDADALRMRLSELEGGRS